MRSLYESILDTDKDITDENSNLGAYMRYELFLQCMEKLLDKREPYTYFPTYHEMNFLLSQDLQSRTADYMYREVETALINYFAELKIAYRKDYNVQWKKRSVSNTVYYHLEFKGITEKNKDIKHYIEFRIRNVRGFRKIEIRWTKDFEFVKAEK